MYKVGLTGNYYSGQHEISQIFEEFNVPVFNANLITKYMLNYSSKHISLIKDTFGENVYSLGLLDLTKFKNNKDFNALLDVIEFDLMKAYEKFRLKHKNEFYTIFYYDFIFERNMDKLLNFNISCFRLKTYRKYDMSILTSLPMSIIQKILDNEMDESIKNNKSDYVIQNYNKESNFKSDIVIGLENQVKSVHKKIMQKKTEDIISRHYY